MSNFEFLLKNKNFNSFSNACIEAEKSILVSPSTCATITRRALELAVKWLYANDSDLRIPYQENLSSLIHNNSFVELIDYDMLPMLRYIVKLGNVSVHTNQMINREEAILALHNLHQFVSWIDYCYSDEYTATDFDEVWKLRQEVSWEDLMLFGTDFQKKVWKKLWELTHLTDLQEEVTCQIGNEEGITKSNKARLVSYSDFVELCQNRAGVRAVAHAIGLNPVSVIIPCHLVIPKEGIDKIREIHKKAQSTIFKGDDLCLDSILADTSIDFGEYALGKSLKRELIIRELTKKNV